MTSRQSFVEKIKALLAKTTANGCTEAEEFAALAKARALRDAYQIDDAELALTREEEAIIHEEARDKSDPHGVKWRLAYAVGKFCGVQIWRTPHVNILSFCGLKADSEWASWLLDHLTDFVQARLVEHLMFSLAPKNERTRVIRGFVEGITDRIATELERLTAQEPDGENNRALILVQNQAIQKKMKEAGITLRGGSGGRRAEINWNSYEAGREAGSGATFGRPVSGKASVRQLR